MGNTLKYPEPEEKFFRFGERLKATPGKVRFDPGEEVDIKLKFKVTNEKVPPLKVDVHVIGVSDVYWVSNPTDAKANEDSITRTMFCSETKEFLNQIHNVDKFENGLKTGYHQFRYFVRLPEDIPGSFLYKYNNGHY